MIFMIFIHTCTVAKLQDAIASIYVQFFFELHAERRTSSYIDTLTSTGYRSPGMFFFDNFLLFARYTIERQIATDKHR